MPLRWFPTSKFILTNWRFFSLWKIKGRAPCYSRKMLFEKFLKCKLCLKNSVKLIKKIKFAVARVKIFLVTRISRNKSIFSFGLLWKLKFKLDLNFPTNKKTKFCSIFQPSIYCNLWQTINKRVTTFSSHLCLLIILFNYRCKKS